MLMNKISNYFFEIFELLIVVLYCTGNKNHRTLLVYSLMKLQLDTIFSNFSNDQKSRTI